MRCRTILTSLSLSTLLLTACGTDDNAANNTAARNDGTEYRNVTYNELQKNWGTGSLGDTTVPGELQNNGVQDERENRVINNRNNERNRFGTFTTNRNPNNINNDNRMIVADRAAKKIVDIQEIERANVIVTDNNAYVAVKLESGATNALTKNVEEKIRKAVKSTDRNINRVYVSVNPDFYTRTTQYANDIRNGRPIEGMFEEFGELVRRVFPTSR